MHLDDVLNKSLALAVWRQNRKKKEELILFTGKVVYKDHGLILDIDGNLSFQIEADWVSHIQKTPKDLKKSLDQAERMLSMHLRDLPKHSKLRRFVRQQLR